MFNKSEFGQQSKKKTDKLIQPVGMADFQESISQFIIDSPIATKSDQGKSEHKSESKFLRKRFFKEAFANNEWASPETYSNNFIANSTRLNTSAAKSPSENNQNLQSQHLFQFSGARSRKLFNDQSNQQIAISPFQSSESRQDGSRSAMEEQESSVQVSETFGSPPQLQPFIPESAPQARQSNIMNPESDADDDELQEQNSQNDPDVEINSQSSANSQDELLPQDHHHQMETGSDEEMIIEHNTDLSNEISDFDREVQISVNNLIRRSKDEPNIYNMGKFDQAVFRPSNISSMQAQINQIQISQMYTDNQ